MYSVTWDEAPFNFSGVKPDPTSLALALYLGGPDLQHLRFHWVLISMEGASSGDSVHLVDYRFDEG